jgi:LuxR family transcriptional regulator, regulator of acetate metabolism
MASGATNTRIAEQLVLSEGTIKSHVSHILRKLHADSRAQAVARYLRIEMRDRENAAR